MESFYKETQSFQEEINIMAAKRNSSGQQVAKIGRSMKRHQSFQCAMTSLLVHAAVCEAEKSEHKPTLSLTTYSQSVLGFDKVIPRCLNDCCHNEWRTSVLVNWPVSWVLPMKAQLSSLQLEVVLWTHNSIQSSFYIYSIISRHFKDTVKFKPITIQLIVD